MSTYLPGVTDYIPQLQPFKPDFNFYAGVLQMKQAKYDAAHERLSNLYGSLLNAPMLRDQNVEARDRFFDAIQQDIHKMSGMDLSLKQNVNAAAGIFNQILDNENIVKDMVWTKNWQNEHQRAEGFRNCIDPEECGGAWWEGGVKALNYKADEFRKASNEDALRFSNARYTPYQNVMEKAIKLADEAGLSVEIDQVQGRYIVTQKNGPHLIQPLQSLFNGVLGNDPAIMDYYRTKAYVDRKDWVASNIEVYGDQASAEQAYLNQMGSSMTQFFAQQSGQLETQSKNIDAQAKYLEEKIERDGTSPTSTLAEQYRQMKGMSQSVNDSLKLAKDNTGRAEIIQNGQSTMVSAEQLDMMMASYYLNGDIGEAANVLAYKDYEYKLKADEYALEDHKQANRIALEDLRFQHDTLLKILDYDLEYQAELEQARGGENGIPSFLQDAAGSYDVNEEQDAPYQMFQEEVEGLKTDISSSERAIMTDVLDRMQEHSKNQGKGSLAALDLLEFGEAMFGSNGYLQGTSLYTQSNWANMVKSDGSSDDAKKLEYMQKWGSTNLKEISGSALDLLYDNVISPIFDMTNEGNQVQRDWLMDTWKTHSGENGNLYQIEYKDWLLSGMNDFYASESKDVLDRLSVAGEEFYDNKDILRAYVNPETGLKRSKEDFLKLYGETLQGKETITVPVYTGEWHGNVFCETCGEIKGYEERPAMSQEELLQYRTEALLYAGIMYDGGGSSYDADRMFDLGRGKTNPLFTWMGSKDLPSLDQMWKNAWGTHMDREAGSRYFGLYGENSLAAQAIRYSFVDPAEYQNPGTMNVISILNDVISANNADRKSTIGRPQETMEDVQDLLFATGADAQAITRQLLSDIRTMTDPEDRKRPILDATYQGIAGGTDEYSAINIKLNSSYVQLYRGSENNPGLMHGEIGDKLLTEGLTLYLKNDVANNAFSIGTQTTPLESLLSYTGEVPIRGYEDITKDFRIRKDKNTGQLSVLGQIQDGFDLNGKKTFRTYTQTYADNTVSADQIVADWSEALRQVSEGIATQEYRWISDNGVYSPTDILGYTK